MSRFPVAAAFLLFAAVAAPSTPAHASTVVSGQIGGEELFPDTADVLRETAALKSELRQSMAVARQLGDRGMAAQIQAMWQKVQGMETEALTRLRQANTTVYLYGAVAGRRDRASGRGGRCTPRRGCDICRVMSNPASNEFDAATANVLKHVRRGHPNRLPACFP